MFYTLGASLCTGIAVSCFLILFFDLASMIELEKHEEMADTKKLPFFIRMFLPLASALKRVSSSELFAEMRKKTAEMLEMSGFDQAVTAVDFLSVRIIMAVAGIILTILLFVGGQLLTGLLVLFLFVAYPSTWLKGVIRRRHLSILKALPNLLDLLTLSVEAGKDFLTALRDILEKRPIDPLGEEFIRALRANYHPDYSAVLKHTLEKLRQCRFSLPVEFQPHFPGQYKCLQPEKHLHVAVDGNCTFCTDYPCFPLGNVKEQSLMEIFTGDAANRFRSAPEKWCCRHCSWKNRENTIIHFPMD